LKDPRVKFLAERAERFAQRRSIARLAKSTVPATADQYRLALH
jgi:hypothetical protein